MGETPPFLGGPRYRVALPLANPANVRPLVTLACGIAGHRTGEVVAFCVVKDRVRSEMGGQRSPVTQAEQRLQIALEVAHPWEVPLRTELVAHRDVATAILEKTREIEADLLVMGWRGGVPRRVGFASEALERVLEHADCDVAIMKPTPRAGLIRRILIADVQGEHVPLAGQVGAAVADRFGAEIQRVELVKPGAGSSAPAAGVSVVCAEGGAAGERAGIVVADSTPEGILGAARGFDLVIVGTPRRSLSRQLLYGSRLEAIARRANASILIVRPAAR
jgi:nucleotide-binding universal stress UspA family protein